jgi:hypothetical protein
VPRKKQKSEAFILNILRTTFRKILGTFDLKSFSSNILQVYRKALKTLDLKSFSLNILGFLSVNCSFYEHGLQDIPDKALRASKEGGMASAGGAFGPMIPGCSSATVAPIPARK